MGILDIQEFLRIAMSFDTIKNKVYAGLNKIIIIMNSQMAYDIAHSVALFPSG